MKQNRKEEKRMYAIGITGGIGSGKTAIMEHLASNYSCDTLLADQAAHIVEMKGTNCYEQLVLLLGEKVLNTSGEIDRQKMAEAIFRDRTLLQQVNNIVHPAVKKMICERINQLRQSGIVDFFFLEAALLIEDNYDEIVDEIWYIYSDEEIRRQRLRQNRQYSDDKIDSIFEKQLSDEEFRKHCKVIITNNGSIEEALLQIDKKLEEYL